MDQLYAPRAVRMAEFRLDPESFIDDSSFQVLAVQRDNASTVYVVKAEIWEAFQKQHGTVKN
jgi:hypothetical protein